LPFALYLFLFLFPSIIDTAEYKNLLAFILAIDEINRDPDILPNVTLGYHVIDSCGDEGKVIQSVLQILTGDSIEIPNYSCRNRGKLSYLVLLYGYSTKCKIHIFCFGFQITSGSTNSELSDRAVYPNFFRTVSGDHLVFVAVVKLLKHFDWTWVGIIRSRDESGERDVRELSHVITGHGICIEYIVSIGDTEDINQKHFTTIQKSTSQVVIVSGTCSTNCLPFFIRCKSLLQNVTTILITSWSVIYNSHSVMEIFNNRLSFRPSAFTIPGMRDYYNNISRSTRPDDPLLEDIFLISCNCVTQSIKFIIFEKFYVLKPVNCTGKKRLTDALDYTVDVPITYYHAVYAMAHALHNMHLHMRYREPEPKKHKYENELQNYIRNVRFTDPSGKKVLFNERGEIPEERFYLVNWKMTTHENRTRTQNCLVGFMGTEKLEDQELRVYEQFIHWKTGKVPRSRCNDPCPPGYRKAPSGGYHACCYVCVQCSEGEVSNITDSEECLMCPETEWPDKRRIRCIPKMYDFLSYENDVMALGFSVISVLFSLLTLLILGIFIWYQVTPIVRANNLNLSFLLLGSILFSFLCVFLFLGRPVDITCKLRHTMFGTIFSVSVSSLLAKTLMVCIAFKATKPGSSWKKWLGIKIPNSIVLICSSIQVLINVIWLSISPPFQEFDLHSYPGKIIIQCNEGSVVAFYSVLGYMGILAAVSFLLAFMVRTLPDSFNEAKYITFSMLVFCSVWISMIPAYLSTKGKDMVSVEIFAILTSSAGLLGCIFFPKCYILLIKPELNKKEHLLEKMVNC
uniref:G-protein coupled receptors family 3 profile domain-containing protein n=1 Tax=Leptobrachium leishanense TaxID=445787 RepID=A0A8C5PK64_9ANUR